MKSKFMLPLSNTYYVFQNLVDALPPCTINARPTIEDIISQYLFWTPYPGLRLAFTESVFDEYLGILFLAQDLMVPKQELEKDTQYQHEQFFPYYSQIWHLLLENDCTSLFDPTLLNQFKLEKIFRQTSELIIQVIEDHAQKENLSKNSRVSVYFILWLWTIRDILVNLFLAEEINATVLWSQEDINEVDKVLHWLEQRNPVNNSNLSGSVLYYHSLLPHIPLIEHESSIIRTYPENVELIAELREDEAISLLQLHLLNIEQVFQSEEKALRWIEEFNSIAEKIEASLKKQRIVTNLMGAIGIGLGIAGIANIVAGIAGVGTTIATPIVNRLLSRPLRNIEESYPYYTNVFKLKKILIKKIKNRSSKKKRNAYKVWYYDPTSFLEELKSCNLVFEKGSQYCMAITKSGHLCKRKTRK